MVFGETNSDSEKVAPTANSREQLRVQLDTFDQQLSELKLLYEQYFLGILTRAPEKEHQMVKFAIRRLRKAPFKSSDIGYRLRALETRYNTLNTYWQRVLKEREAGTYCRDVFKANLHERMALEAAHAQTAGGKAEQGMRSLFDIYKKTVEQHTGKSDRLDYAQFEKTLLNQANELRSRSGASKLSFAIVVKDGKVSVKAKVKE